MERPRTRGSPRCCTALVYAAWWISVPRQVAAGARMSPGLNFSAGYLNTTFDTAGSSVLVAGERVGRTRRTQPCAHGRSAAMPHICGHWISALRSTRYWTRLLTPARRSCVPSRSGGAATAAWWPTSSYWPVGCRWFTSCTTAASRRILRVIWPGYARMVCSSTTPANLPWARVDCPATRRGSRPGESQGKEDISSTGSDRRSVGHRILEPNVRAGRTFPRR
jgi:hypothetical protein